MLNNQNQGHRKRLKNRFLSEGLDNFEHHNVLELLLFFSIPRIDTNKIAHNLIDNFGSISNVFDAPYEEILKVDGIGENTAILLKMIPEMSRVYLSEQSNFKNLVNTPEKIGQYLLPKFVGRNEEVVYLVCLDNACNVLSCNLLFEGTVNTANINVRKIAETAIKYNAPNIVLSHNHPKGLALPSNEDLVTTEMVIQSLKPLGINVLDHIIVSRGDFISFAQSGYLNSEFS